MKKILGILVLLMLASPTLASTFYSYAFGKRYCFEIAPEMLAKSPSWDGNADDTPLPAGKAVRLANSLKNRLVKDSKDFKWHLVSAELEHDFLNEPDSGKWWWAIRYEAHIRQGGESGIPNHLKIIVLMDGTVIEPKITEADSRE
jgi:hypothetical protein